jgi:hypothetical protein
VPGVEPSWKEIIEAGVNTELDRIFKACPATVTTYDPITNTAFVRPSVKRAIYTGSGERKYEDLPEIPFVPVMWPRAGGMVMRMPLSPGDTVLLVFSDVSLAEWRDGADPAEPIDARLHGFGWPIAIPGLFPDTNPLNPLDAVIAAASAMFGLDGGSAQIIVDATPTPMIRFGKLAVSPIALAVPTDAALATVVTAINAVISTLNAMVSAYNAHTHPVPGVTTGTGATTSSATTSTVSAPAAGPSAPGTTASTLVTSL